MMGSTEAEAGADRATMDDMHPDHIIYDWNSVEKVAPLSSKPIEFMDETLRGDLSRPADVLEMARRALEGLGEVDLYTADAGVRVSSGCREGRAQALRASLRRVERFVRERERLVVVREQDERSQRIRTPALEDVVDGDQATQVARHLLSAVRQA